MAARMGNMGAGKRVCKGFAKQGFGGILARARMKRPPRMTMFHDLSMKSDEVLRVELEEFRRQHRDLDEAITALEEKATSDRLTIRRLKQQKLRLKDRIAWIEDRLYPDIIA
jgi:hypothetical protein